MMNRTWFKNPDHVVYAVQDEVVPRLSRELGISGLDRRIEAFRKAPTRDGENIKGCKRTTLKLMIPDLAFQEHIEMGENVWIYMGELCPAYCLYTPWAGQDLS